MATDTKEASEILSPSKLEAQTYEPEDQDKHELKSWFLAFVIVESISIALTELRHPRYPPNFDDPNYGPAWFQHGLLNIFYAAAFFSMMYYVLTTFDSIQARSGGFFNTNMAKGLKVLLAVSFGMVSYLHARREMGDLEPVWTFLGWY
ncbi:hypothetical protein LTS10_008324 [Elasticomyces elasticus]|nr:hypothetical protein LTS10_008324 [Elasticomyces elasticus]